MRINEYYMGSIIKDYMGLFMVSTHCDDRNMYVS